MPILFVYGTLMTGQPNHHVLAGCRCVGPVTTASAYTLVDLGPYPGLREGGVDPVPGELYEVREEDLVRLDLLEGHPNLYRRQQIGLDDGERALAYLLPEGRFESAPRISAWANLGQDDGDE